MDDKFNMNFGDISSKLFLIYFIYKIIILSMKGYYINVILLFSMIPLMLFIYALINKHKIKFWKTYLTWPFVIIFGQEIVNKWWGVK